MSSLESSSPTTASPRFHNNPEEQNLNIKSYLMMLIEEFKKDINNSLKEVQKNMVNSNKPLKAKKKIILVNKGEHESTGRSP